MAYFTITVFNVQSKTDSAHPHRGQRHDLFAGHP